MRHLSSAVRKLGFVTPVPSPTIVSNSRQICSRHQQRHQLRQVSKQRSRSFCLIKKSTTQTMSTEEKVLNDVDNNRYRLQLENIEEPAFLEYEVRSIGATSVYDLMHTFVPPSMRGRGVAARLVDFAVNHARENGHKIIPTCTYIVTYMKRHPQNRDVLINE